MENYFFGHYIDPISLGGKAFFLLLAILFGGVIGFERQFSGNFAGTRTHILVCLGATMMTFTSVEIGMGVRGGMRGDPAHLAAQIISGIGFLGAGAILRNGMSVHGLTTAAGVWVTAGLGIALGASPRLAEMAVIATPMTLGTLIAINRLELALKLKSLPQEAVIDMRPGKKAMAHLFDTLFTANITVYGVVSETIPATGEEASAGQVRLRVRLKLPRDYNTNRLNKLIMSIDGVSACRAEEE